MKMTLSGKESFLPQPRPATSSEKETCPFIVAVDTREQRPFIFAGLGLEIITRRTTLKTGDYSILGLEKYVCVERKSKEDLFGSCTSGRKRFEKELVRMSQMERSCVIVECSMEDVKAGLPGSKIDPLSIVNTAIAWAGRYRVPWHFMPTRGDAEKAAFDHLRFAWQDLTSRTPLLSGLQNGSESGNTVKN